MPPRTTEKSYRPRVSDRTMVDTQAQPSACPRFRNRPRSLGSAFPPPRSFQNGPKPSRVRNAAPSGAPLTAPDRSEQHFLIRGKAGIGNQALANMAILTTNLPTVRVGAGCQGNYAWSGSEEKLFLLTSPFIELPGGPGSPRKCGGCGLAHQKGDIGCAPAEKTHRRRRRSQMKSVVVLTIFCLSTRSLSSEFGLSNIVWVIVPRVIKGPRSCGILSVLGSVAV